MIELASVRHALRPAWRGIKANWLAALVLQVFAFCLVLSYFQSAVVAEALDWVGRLKVEWGYSYSIVSTALFGGLIPFLVLWASGRIRAKRRLKELLFYLAFWSWKGAEIDALYRGQAWLFGDGAGLDVIASKTAVDQFVYNTLWGAPTQTLCFLWKDSGFSLATSRRLISQQSLLHRVLTVLLSTWVVWIPAVAIVYSLPTPLQLPLFNLVLCFWCLLLSFVSRNPSNEADPRQGGASRGA